MSLGCEALNFLVSGASMLLSKPIAAAIDCEYGLANHWRTSLMHFLHFSMVIRKKQELIPLNNKNICVRTLILNLRFIYSKIEKEC
jgi:hypothetical protein